jgi:hypothetical protein
VKDTTSQHVELTRSIDRWLQQIDVGGPDAAADSAVDLADILHAAADVRSLLTELLATNPNAPSQASQALQLASNIEVQLFTELKAHLDNLEQAWPKVLERLDSLSA